MNCLPCNLVPASGLLIDFGPFLHYEQFRWAV